MDWDMKIGDQVMLIGRSIDEDRLGLILGVNIPNYYLIMVGDQKLKASIHEVYTPGKKPDESKLEFSRWTKTVLYGNKFSTGRRIRF